MPEFSEFRYAPFEFRQTDDGLGVVEGTIIRYGDIATFPWGTEEVKAGAFGDFSQRNVRANRMHQRDQALGNTLAAKNLRITNDEKEMRAALELPNTSYGRDTAVEVAGQILTGLSLEFRSVVDKIDDAKQHRTIEKAEMYGFGVVDAPAYPQSSVIKRWADYTAACERAGVTVTLPVLSESGVENPRGITQTTQNLGQLLQRDVPEWARQNCYLDHKGRLIFIGGDLDCRYEDFDVEDRQMPRLRGRLPYGVDGITSMARNEHVRFLPGAFGDSLDGEILALVGGDYDNPLGGTAQRSLSLVDADDALTFSTSRIPETTVNRDFVTKLRSGFVRGVTAGWALQGSDTTTEAIPGGGTRIVVRKAMLCELRFRTRSAFAGESIQASPRRREAIRFQVA